MSGPAVVAVLQFAGTALSMKTVVDGIAEGNLVKAALGGVGAYMMGQGLVGGAGAEVPASEAAKSVAYRDLGTATGDKAATMMGAQEVAKDAAGNQMWTLADAAKTGGASIGSGNVAANVGGNVASNVGANTAQSSGFLDWMNRNPVPTYGLMQAGGSLLSGYAQGEMAQKQVDELRRQDRIRREEEAARRERIGNQGDIGFLNDWNWSPYTYKPVGGANG